ncbi:MAG: mycothiol conjugate amidase Mca [Micrococcales bacterium]|nr:mycothiol conjugate amidase Mca [Micrococcales bacterium]MCL2666113.1 mycothiol conjugate amidase Mca [Micrococcales bacterium]
MSLRLMAVHAHPDDEASKGGATCAKYAAQGVEVLVVTCTGGERGTVLNPQFTGPVPTTMAQTTALRRDEMAAAAAALGVRQQWLGFVDSGLPEGDPVPPLPPGCFAAVPLEQATAALVEVVREFRPHVMTTYDPSGGYPHPDHVRTHEVGLAAYHAAGDGDQFVEAGPPWQVTKLYYDVTFSSERIGALHTALTVAGLASPFEGWLRRPRPPATTRVECAPFFGARDAALRAHASQVDPAGIFFAMPRDLEAQVWPYEEFALARSHVMTTTPEDDLFAGIGDDQ